MSGPDVPAIPPLPPSLRGLIDSATAGPGPTAAARARLESRLAATMGGGSGGPGPASGGHGLAARIAAKIAMGVTAAAAITTTIWLATPSTTSSRSPAKHEALSKPAAPLPVEQGDPDPRTSGLAPDDRASASERPTPVPAPHPARRASVVAPPPDPVPPERAGDLGPNRPSVPPAPIAGAATDPALLARERGLLEDARRALAAHAAPHAIDRLDAHRAEFPDGQLAEEREALMVQALAMVGSPLAAAARARSFRVQYPHSIFLDLVDAVAPAAKPRSQDAP